MYIGITVGLIGFLAIVIRGALVSLFLHKK